MKILILFLVMSSELFAECNTARNIDFPKHTGEYLGYIIINNDIASRKAKSKGTVIGIEKNEAYGYLFSTANSQNEKPKVIKFKKDLYSKKLTQSLIPDGQVSHLTGVDLNNDNSVDVILFLAGAFPIHAAAVGVHADKFVVMDQPVCL